MDTRNAAQRNDAGRNGRTPGTLAPKAPRTVEELLDAERARALAGLSLSLGDLGAELGDAVERCPLARNPALAGGAALVLGALGAPMIARAAGPSLRLLGSTTVRALALALAMR